MGDFDHIEDDLLIEEICHGNQRAFSSLYDRYVKLVYNKCFSFVQNEDDAEDLTQEIFVKLNNQASKYESGNFRAWLLKLTFNVCVDFHRKASKFYHTEYSDILHDTPSDAYDVSKDELFEIQLDKLKIALEQINPEDKLILLLKYMEGKKISEIAVITSLSESAIKMRLSRSKQKLVILTQIPA